MPNETKRTGSIYKWLMWVPAFILVDQLSKSLILQKLNYGESLSLFPGLRFTLAHNYGIAFSLLNHQAPFTQFILMGIVGCVCVALGILLVKTPTDDRWTKFALVLILGGALGNLMDRFLHGYVIDFIDVYIQHWHFYTFNVADSYITLGALMMIKNMLFSNEDERVRHVK